MKNIFLKCAFLFFSLVLVTSCSSDDDGPEEAPTVAFRASVGGQNVRTDNVNATLSNEGVILTIVAPTDLGALTITLGTSSLDSPLITNRTYQIDETGTASIRISSLDSNFSSNADLGGSIIITEINTEEQTVFGSFSTTVVNSIDSGDIIPITNGALFNVNYTIQ